MSSLTPQAQPPRPQIEVRFRIPAVWHDELVQSSEALGLSIASLLRVVVRTFLRERYDEQTKAILREPGKL